MAGWEYRTMFVKVFTSHLDTHAVDDTLNHLGADGWELVTVTPLMEDHKTVGMFHHFRRPKGAQKPAGFMS